MTSESTRKDFHALQSEKLKTVFEDSDYLLTESPDDIKENAATGITTLFRQFPYTHHTFQFIKKDARSPVMVFTDAKEAAQEAINKNTDGFDVYFMVNEGDGVRHEGKKTPRSQESVTELSQFFIDTDGCPIVQVREYLDNLQLRPHLVIESSKDRYHLYFHFYPVEKTAANIIRWKAVQHMLARLGDVNIKSPAKQLGMDQTMHDYAKLLRVPGFTHVRKLWMVRIVEDNEHPFYDFADFFTTTDAQSWIDHSTSTSNGVATAVPDLTSDSIIEAGERWQTLQSLSLHLANTTDRNTATKIYETFVRTRLNNEDQVYANNDGELTYKARSLLTTALDKVEREQRISSAVMDTSLVVTTDPETATASLSPWYLSDEFYLSAPNGFGDVVRQCMQYSLYPYASLAFGAFLTGLSILKSRTHLTPHGSSTALYTLNVAISGLGKSDPLTLLQNTFVSLGLKRLISNELRSDRGLYTHLSMNDGTGLFILDEVAPLFKAIQDKNATSYHANIGKAFLHLFSAGAMKGLSFGKLGSSNSKKGEQEIVIDNPMLALLGFTVPSKFNSMFSPESVSEGLFQRFIPIIADVVDVPENKEADKTAIIKSDLFSSAVEQSATELDADGNVVASIQTIPRVRMSYTVEAREAFTAIQRDYRKQLIQAALDPATEPMSGLYSRIAEQIERVAAVLTLGDTIELSTLEYARMFIESRHKATLAMVGKSLMGGDGAKAQEKENIITSNVGRLCRIREMNYVSQRDLYQSVRRSFHSWKDFNEALQYAHEAGSIEVIKNFKKDTKAAKPMTVIRLANVLN